MAADGSTGTGTPSISTQTRTVWLNESVSTSVSLSLLVNPPCAAVLTVTNVSSKSVKPNEHSALNSMSTSATFENLTVADDRVTAAGPMARAVLPET